MDSCKFISLLPDNATPLETDIERVMQKKYCDADIRIIKALSNPWECPAEFLPWLAYAESVDVWNDRWPEATKRSVIANAKTLHYRKGTTGGVKDALAALGVHMEMISWQHMEPEGEIGTASFELWINENFNPDAAVMLDTQMITDITQTLNRNKRLSVHYELSIGVALTSGVAVNASAQFASQTSVDASHVETTITSQSSGPAIAASAQLSTQLQVEAAHISTAIKTQATRLGLGLSAQFTTITYLNFGVAA